MKKIYALFLIFVFILGLTACKKETVELHCDGENCENTVVATVKKSGTPDESWVVFCENCSDTILSD